TSLFTHGYTDYCRGSIPRTWETAIESLRYSRRGPAFPFALRNVRCAWLPEPWKPATEDRPHGDGCGGNLCCRHLQCCAVPLHRPWIRVVACDSPGDRGSRGPADALAALPPRTGLRDRARCAD